MSEDRETLAGRPVYRGDVTEPSDDRAPYPFSLCRTATGKRTHLGLDYGGHPTSQPGRPRGTLCDHDAVPLAPDENPWKDLGEVECRQCLLRSEFFLHLPGWPSLAAALAIFARSFGNAEA